MPKYRMVNLDQEIMLLPGDNLDQVIGDAALADVSDFQDDTSRDGSTTLVVHAVACSVNDYQWYRLPKPVTVLVRNTSIAAIQLWEGVLPAYVKEEKDE